VHAVWCVAVDPHHPDECVSGTVQPGPGLPDVWVTRTPLGAHVVVDVPGFPPLDGLAAVLLRDALTVCAALIVEGGA
jgi:hypothetical protein